MKRKITAAVLAALCAMGIALCSACKPSDTTAPHEHTFDMTKWEYDENTHWHRATCEHDGEKKDEQSHSFDGDICTECGYDKTAPLPGKTYKTVTFDLNYDTDETLPAKQFEVGKLMTGLPFPEREGYKFICWKTLVGEEFTAASVMPNRDLTLYADWQKTVGTYKDEFVLFKPATEGYKSPEILLEYSNEHIDKYVYVEITSDDLGGVQNLGKKDNFTLKTIDGMEYKVNAGYTWMWYQRSFDSLNGAQRFTLEYGSNVQLITVLDGGGNLLCTYLLDIYVKHDYKVSLYKSIFDSEPYDAVRVIEGDTFPSNTPAAETSFEYDKRVYMNVQTNEFEDFVYSTLIYKDWSLYQTYKPYTVETELNEGTLDGELKIKPYTQYFTLPSPEKDGFDFLGWQDTNGKYITNVQGYSGAHYISEEYLPEKLTAVYAEKKHYYDFDGEKLRVYAHTVPVVTYTDKTMETILEIVYVPYGEDCTLPVTVPEYENAAFSGWQSYNNYSGEWETALTDFDFNCKITSPIALAPETAEIGNVKVIPINAKKTFNNGGDYKFYLPTAQDYTMEITTTGNLSFSLQTYSATSPTNYTVSSDSPKTITVYNYRYNLGAEVKEPGTILMNVKSLSGSFTVKITGATATTESSPVGVYDSQKAVSQKHVSIEAAQKNAYSFSGWYKGEQRVTQEFEYSFPLTETAVYDAKWELLPHLEDFNFIITDTEIIITGAKNKATTLIVPDCVTSINQGAFKNCSKLESLTLPFVGNGSDVPYLGYIFGASTYRDNGEYVPASLKTVIITGVTSIGDRAFSGCKSLTSITIPDSVTSIGEDAFSGCTKLESVYITDIAAWCNIEFDSKPLYYAHNLYLNNQLVTELTAEMLQGVTTIKDYAFAGFGGTSITIPDSVTSIGEDAFYNCTNLKGVYITDIAAWCNIDFGSSKANPLYYAHNLYLNNQLVTELTAEMLQGVTTIKKYAFAGFGGTSITIPDSVTSIGGYAFSGCTGLTNMTIPNNVTSIGDGAFYNCTNLESLTLPFVSNGSDVPYLGYIFGARTFINNGEYVPASLKTVIITGGNSIGDWAFSGCTNLTSITIPDSVTSIGGDAFAGCTSLESITIPDNVTSIGGRAFDKCTNLKGVYITDIAAWCNIDFVNETANPLFCAHNLYLNNQLVTELTAEMLQGVTTIKKYAFAGCTSLESITIPDNVTSIDKGAFKNCSKLESVTFNNPSGWYYEDRYFNSIEKFNISSENLQNPQTAAEYLRSKYCECDWGRKTA